MTTVCLSANTLYYPEGGGHRWVYLNWALGLLAAGCDVFWLEGVDPATSDDDVRWLVERLAADIAPYGLEDRIALWSYADDGDDYDAPAGRPMEGILDADLLLNFAYGMPDRVVQRFRHSALIDIDPGLLQLWLSRGELTVAPHDVWFTTGETVASGSSSIPDTGRMWIYTPPAVCVDAWPVHCAPDQGPYSTLTHWWDDEVFWDGESRDNSKRVSFRPYLGLPREAGIALEIACDLPEDDEDVSLLRANGWRVSSGVAVAGSASAYQQYIRASRGEFACVKPSCLWFANAWVSDRTLCYLATGRPAVVQHTGASSVLPDRSGLLRFRTPQEAAALLNEAESDYDRHSREARALVEAHFDARGVAMSVLERALP
ncbi:MAG: hypothetical protein JOZ68_20830 [Acidimicrobiia bacterium]|nr:hypothetical protein [Acidimicrobiia bacterium]MBV9043446.1 hypothetical protein [Acidimicrobiia bacterium]